MVKTRPAWVKTLHAVQSSLEADRGVNVCERPSVIMKKLLNKGIMTAAR